MAARITKLELQQTLAALGAEVEALRVENAQLKATLAVRERAAPKPLVRAYTPPAPTPEQSAYRAALAAARELAMRTGRAVRGG
jgi:hypothetical protein